MCKMAERIENSRKEERDCSNEENARDDFELRVADYIGQSPGPNKPEALDHKEDQENYE